MDLVTVFLLLPNLLHFASCAPRPASPLPNHPRFSKLADGIDYMPDEYIIGLNDDYNFSSHLSFLNVTRNTSQASFEPLKLSNAYFGHFGTDMLNKVLQDPGVKLVEQNEIGIIPDWDEDDDGYGNKIYPSANETSRPERAKRDVFYPYHGAPWDLVQMSEEEKNQNTDAFIVDPRAYGTDVDVYILDTGVQQFHSNAIGTYYDADGAEISVAYDATPGDYDPADHEGHGTAVASLIAGTTNGVARGASIASMKVCPERYGCTAENTIRALELVRIRENQTKTGDEQGKAVINMSFNNKAINTEVSNQIEGAYRENIVMFASAGNSDRNSDDTIYPCAYALVNCVGATTQDYNKWYKSNFGSKVLFVAPGGGVQVAWPNKDVPSGQMNDKLISGTSFASPLVAGMAAGFISYEGPYVGPMDVFTRLRENGDKGKSEGWGSKRTNEKKTFVNTGHWKAKEGDPYLITPLLGGGGGQ